jgi:hypothetical protein
MGLSKDKSGIDSNPVHRELALSSKSRHAVMVEVWEACGVDSITLSLDGKH